MGMQKRYDFYFSAKQKHNQIYKAFSRTRKYFKGQEYTERVSSGAPITSSFDDFILVGTGLIRIAASSPLPKAL